MSNRFRKTELLDCAGFPILKYGSLLKRERDYILEFKNKQANTTLNFLNLAQEISNDLGISEEEAWHVISSDGLTSTGEDIKAKVLPYLLKFRELFDSTSQDVRYLNEAIVLLLRSRLKPEHLEEIASELEEAFDIKITDKQLSQLKKVSFSDYLSNSLREQICRAIASNLTIEITEALFQFYLNELNQWKPIEQEEQKEVIDENDPLQ